MITSHICAVYFLAYKVIAIKEIRYYFLIYFIYKPCDLRDIIFIEQMRNLRLKVNKKLI